MTLIAWTRGTTYVAQPFSLPVDLTGVSAGNITVQRRLKALSASAAYQPLAGSVSITGTGNPSTIQYTFAAADVADVGTYQLIVVVNFGGSLWESFPVDFTIA